MECTRILSIAICCLMLTVKCIYSQSQFPVGYDPNNNADKIYFIDDRPRITLPPLTFQQPTVNQQPSTFQQAAFQQATNQQDRQSLSDQEIDQIRSAGAKAVEIIHFDETATALTTFSINLMKQISQQQSGNKVVSPYSIATLLALLHQGATGATLEQLSAALHMNQQSSAAAYKALTLDIQNRSSRNILRTANNIFLANGFSLNQAFRASALNDFRSDVTPTNFALTGQATQEINKWVSDKTDHKIENLIAPDSLSVNTQMVLVNAMYFKGLWELPFRRTATIPGEFRLSSRAIKTAKFMKTRRYFKTGIDSYTASKVLVLPFEREEYSLMVILPNSLYNIADILSTLTASRLEEYLNFPYLDTELELPKFSIKTDTDLTTLLTQMGISKLFTASDLTKIGTFQGTQSPQVSNAVHSAAFTIDEEGGTASASTAFAVVALSNDAASVVFRANRPFLAVLWDGKAKVPLFMAQIEDPTL